MMNISSYNFFKIYYKLSASYWFIPAIMVLCAAMAAFLANYISDTSVGDWISDIGYFQAVKAEGARTILSTIANSMITVAGVTFSMTIIAISFASSQFGPRLIGNFMHDRGNQFTLGTFVSTYVFCLIVLGNVHGPDEGNSIVADIPVLSILLALFFAIVSVLVLIFYIHHIPERINISNIVSRVSREALKKLDELFPDSIGHADTFDETIDIDQYFKESFPIKSRNNGYILAIESDKLMDVAKEHNLVLRLQYRPGDFVFEGETLLISNKTSGNIAEKLEKCFSFGRERTSNQNILFLMDELVEIMARALSPGVNDPVTAIACMNWQKCILHKTAHLQPTSPYRYDSNRNLRIIAYPMTFKLLASNVFDKPRQYVAKDRNTALHAMKIIADLIASLPYQSEYIDILHHHATRLNEAAQHNLPLRADRKIIQDRYESLQTLMTDTSLRARMRDDQGWLGGRG